jgi:hypothetical protein
MKTWKVARRILTLFPVFVFSVLLLGTSGRQEQDLGQQVHALTREVEFDFLDWTLNALGVKLSQISLGSDAYLEPDQRRNLVISYLELVARIQQTEAQIGEIYADPNVTDPQAVSADLRADLEAMQKQRRQIAPVAEAILQQQISAVVAELGLTAAGQPVPPVLYHSTPLPWALIVSPRDAIRMEADISLVPELSLDQRVALEEQVDESLDVSSLAVGIGGIGLYPTMVQQTSSLEWLSEVVAHEWVHNFLTLRPLGLNYMDSPELRTINETTAAMAGEEIGRAVLEAYYPELLPPPAPPESQPSREVQPAEPPEFNFYDEMRETRVEVDRLLAEGKVEEAEAYMEDRRVIFWENGYHLRKLNQAYFAFHGAYADNPRGGAAGEDPVGAAVRKLRQQSASLAEFLNRISWITTFDELKKLVEQGDTDCCSKPVP